MDPKASRWMWKEVDPEDNLEEEFGSDDGWHALGPMGSQRCEEATYNGVPVGTVFYITISHMISLKILLLASRPEGLIFCRPNPRVWILCKPARRPPTVFLTCDVETLRGGKRILEATMASGRQVAKFTIFTKTTWKQECTWAIIFANDFARWPMGPETRTQAEGGRKYAQHRL